MQEAHLIFAGLSWQGPTVWVCGIWYFSNLAFIDILMSQFIICIRSADLKHQCMPASNPWLQSSNWLMQQSSYLFVHSRSF